MFPKEARLKKFKYLWYTDSFSYCIEDVNYDTTEILIAYSQLFGLAMLLPNRLDSCLIAQQPYCVFTKYTYSWLHR